MLSPVPTWKRNLWVMTAGVFLAQVGFSMVVSFLPFYLQEMGTTRDVAFWSGMVFSVTSFTYALVAPIWGALSDRFGKRSMLLRSGLGIAVSYLLMAASHTHLQLFAMRAVMGVLAGFVPAATMLVASNTPEDQLGVALGAVQTGVAVGTISGPLIGGLVSQIIGGRATFLVAAVIVGLTGVLAWALAQEEVQVPERSTSILGDLRGAFSDPGLSSIFVALLLVQGAVLAVQPALPLIVAKMVRANVNLMSGLILSLLGLATALAAPFVSRKASPTRAITIFQGGIVAAAVLSALQALSPSLLVLGMLRFLFGFANAAMVVTGNVLVAQRAEPSARGRAFGVLNSMTSLGAVVGPLVGGFLAGRFSFQAAFYGGTGLLVAAWWASSRKAGRRADYVRG